MPERIEVPDEFPAAGNVSGKRVILTGAGRGLRERPSKGLAAYSASKAGLVGMAKALALDLARSRSP